MDRGGGGGASLRVGSRPGRLVRHPDPVGDSRQGGNPGTRGLCGDVRPDRILRASRRLHRSALLGVQRMTGGTMTGAPLALVLLAAPAVGAVIVLLFFRFVIDPRSRGGTHRKAAD